MSKQVCGHCWYYSKIDHRSGTCCVEPPTAVATMGGSLLNQRPQPVAMGIDPPVAKDRIGCRHWTYKPAKDHQDMMEMETING